jgi:ubiquinone/menaquinone biosynthesis C-methylase UbiE
MAESTRLIAEQIRYYDARAGEYDETTTPPGEDPLARQGAGLRRRLHAFGPRGKVLEIAAGTGTWTQVLVEHATELTVLDASRQMLELCRHKVGQRHVRYIDADIFHWEADGVYDVVFFANWLSHVPPDRFEPFWDLVDRCLAPAGRVFFLDEETEEVWRQEEFRDKGKTVVRRRLRAGRTFDIVKVFYSAHELQERLRLMGWRAGVHSTGDLYWGEARRTLRRGRGSHAGQGLVL